MAAVARYRLDSTAEHLEHLIAPLLKAGWKVDDFYLYDGNLGGNAAWQPKAAPVRTIGHSSTEAIWLRPLRFFSRNRGPFAPRNFVHMHKEINMLWQQVEVQRKKAQDFSIHTSCIVMFICDDAYRLKDFDSDVANHWHRHCAAGGGHMFSLAMLLL